MSLDLTYPALTDMLDEHFRAIGDGDEAAVEAFVAARGDEARDEVLAELRELRAAGHDPIDLHLYFMVHRFDPIPDEGVDAWLARLEDLLERAF